MIFFFSIYFSSLYSVAVSMSFGRITLAIAQWIAIAFYTVIALLSVRIQMLFSKGIVIGITFFCIPYMFFETGGYYGTVLMFTALFVFAIAMIFKGRARIFMALGVIVIYGGCVILQYLFPGLAVPFTSPEAVVIEHIITLVLVVAVLSITTVYISNTLDYEERVIKSLLADMEQANKKLEEMSNRDALTGAYNRRYFSEFMERTIQSCNETGRFIHCLLMDLDHFKRINDTYGHGFGDEVLIATVRAIGDVLRESDVIIRFGGEEFMVVIYDAVDSVALNISERICDSIRNLTFRNGVKVSISIGMVRSKPNETPEDIFARADTLLYRAKSEGRNRVCFESNYSTDKKL